MAKPDIVRITADSPEELREIAETLRRQNTPHFPYVRVGLSGDDFVLRPFVTQAASLTAHQIRQHILSETIDLLGLPSDEIALDFQILTSEPVIRGIYSAMPIRQANRYRDALVNSPKILISLTPEILLRFDGFLAQRRPGSAERFCLIDFTHPHRVRLAVFFEKACEVIRCLPWTSLEELHAEILQSLRRACALSRVKRVDTVTFFGDMSVHQPLIHSVRKDFLAEIQYDPEGDSLDPPKDPAQTFFTINLLRDEEMSLSQRQKALAFIRLLTILALFSGGFQAKSIWEREKYLQELSTQYTSLDVQYAQSLMAMLNNLPPPNG